MSIFGDRKPPQPRESESSLMSQSLRLQEGEQWAEALQVEQKLLSLRESKGGPTGSVYEHSVLNVCELQATLAQECVHQNRLGEATQLLNRAQKATKHPMLSDAYSNVRRLACRAHIHNCTTCLRKAQGDVRGSLKAAEKALGVLLNVNLLDQLPACYLNLSALYSNLGLHTESLRHAFFGLEILKQLVAQATRQAHAENAQIDAAPAGQAEKRRRVEPEAVPVVPDPVLMAMEPQEVRNQPPPPKSHPRSVVSVRPSTFSGVASTSVVIPEAAMEPAWRRLNRFGEQIAICYFNVAVEQEYLGQSCALATFRVSVDTATEHMGPDHPLTLQFRKSTQKAERAARRRHRTRDDAGTGGGERGPSPLRADEEEGAVGEPLDMTAAALHRGPLPQHTNPHRPSSH